MVNFLSIHSLISLFNSSDSQIRLNNIFEKNSTQKTLIKGVIGSGVSVSIANAFLSTSKNIVINCSDKEEASYLFNDFENLLSPKKVLFFPSSYRKPYENESVDNVNVLLRSEVLSILNYTKTPKILITYPQALFEKVISFSTLKKNTFKVSKGDTLSISFLNEMLFAFDFERVDFVSQPGEFSVRGGILDVFSFSNQFPYRIEFFDDEIESLRTFDITTQLSISVVESFSLLPNTSESITKSKRKNILSVFDPAKTVVVNKDLDVAYDKLKQYFYQAESIYKELNSAVKKIEPPKLFTSADEFLELIFSYSCINLTKSKHQQSSTPIVFRQSPQLLINKKINLLSEALIKNKEQGIKTFICCSNSLQTKRLESIFEEHEVDMENIHILTLPLHEGFLDLDAKIAVYTDHQIFERHHKFNIKSSKIKKNALSLKEINHLTIGDYITHIDHGVGTFGGLQKIEVEGKLQEVIKLIYADRDILYVSIHSLYKITKFSGKDGKEPKVFKLGSTAWKTIKKKTKKTVKEIAFNLIKLYAQRKEKIGFSCAPDSYLQTELEASFIYEDTPDQGKTSEDVKKDMESEHPMDRLVCGDVGFGKTEIAIRAAFKAVDNGMQVAVLVPTTILAFQHYKSFSNRLKDFPVSINYLNRFKSTKEKKEILAQLENQKLDIIIGTHQLVNKSVKYKNFGLLIVDEEQKFGVAIKEKLRDIKKNIDVLTLTATPIPRTLQFSLMAARDLSVIKTPPPNRHPIESDVIRFSEEQIRDGVSFELQRGGQVYFIHNRVENIKEVAGLIQRLVPDAKIRVGHGQMDGKKLEDTLLNFINGQFDVLVATTIIENGLDVPNANTIFINNAQAFGLSDLHQMRGRVGRSNRKAFCYFITPPLVAMSSDAQKRIKAIEQYKELGSGVQIAMKDLEIRGSGNLLGGEQSGFINEIGFETYQKILNEAITELKESEFKELFKDDTSQSISQTKDLQFETDLVALIPDDYVNNNVERLNLYTELNSCKNEKELHEFETKIIDRFGQPPIETVDLITSVKLKWKCQELGFVKIILKQQKFIASFPQNQESTYFSSDTFNKILVWASQQTERVELKQRNVNGTPKLSLVIKNIDSIEEGLEVLVSI